MIFIRPKRRAFSSFHVIMMMMMKASSENGLGIQDDNDCDKMMMICRLVKGAKV
jgi:hypothetical protein